MQQTRTTFPNKAGDHADTDEILTAELNAAGIQTLEQLEGPLSDHIKMLFRKNSGEVKTSVIGHLLGWSFIRNWRYWVCKGPGIPNHFAEQLHMTHGEDVRVDGFAGGEEPIKRFYGLGAWHYHVDTAEGLKALADMIKFVSEKAKNESIFKPKEQTT